MLASETSRRHDREASGASRHAVYFFFLAALFADFFLAAFFAVAMFHLLDWFAVTQVTAREM